jgi:hypothetical protein
VKEQAVFELKQSLAARLKELRVRIEIPDEDTAVFRNVATNARFFNKARTSLLVKRAQEGWPFLVCVDEDLEYVGEDAALARAFAGGVKRDGWRVLFLDFLHPPKDATPADFQAAVQTAMAALGFDGSEPCLPLSSARAAPSKKGLLAAFGENLSQSVREDKAQVTVGRDDEIEEVAACLLRCGEVRLSIVAGESGVGKTNLLHGVAHRLSQARPGRDLVSVDLAFLFAGTLFEAERENLFLSLFKEASASAETLLALEHLERAVCILHGPLLLSQALDGGARIVGTALPAHLSGFRSAPLARRVHVTELSEPTAAETDAILMRARGRIAAHHGVQIDDSTVHACVSAAQTLAGCFPAKAIALLDAAASRAALSGAPDLSGDEIYFAAARVRSSQEWVQPDGEC